MISLMKDISNYIKSKHIAILVSFVLIFCLCGTIPALAVDRDVENLINKLNNDYINGKIQLFPSGFDPADFDPDEFDPFLLRGIWADAIPEIQNIINQEPSPVNLNRQSFTMNFGKVEGRPGRFKVIFYFDDLLSYIFMKSFSIPKQCFNTDYIQQDVKMMAPYVIIDSFKHKYVRNGDLRLDLIANDVSIFINDSISLDYGVGSRHPVFERNQLLIVTEWKYIKERGASKFYWRMEFEVSKYRGDDGWLIKVAVSVGRRSIYDRPENIRIYNDPEAKQTLFAEASGNTGKQIFLPKERKYIQQRSGAAHSSQPKEVDPKDISPLAEINKNIYDQIKKILLI